MDHCIIAVEKDSTRLFHSEESLASLPELREILGYFDTLRVSNSL
jgi:hypothetical protein